MAFLGIECAQKDVAIVRKQYIVSVKYGVHSVDQEIIITVQPDLEVALRPSTGTISRLAPLSSRNFSFVPIDGNFGVNRTLPGFSALGDVSLRVRPATLQAITLPPVAYLQEYPIYTSLSTDTVDPGISCCKSRFPALQS